MATQNEHQGPVKNRWTRWYMWLAYGSAAFVVVIIIAAATSSGDSATVAPEEPAANAEAGQSAEQVKQTEEAAERYEEQTKAAEKQAEAASELQTKEAEAASEIQTKEAENTSQAAYCDELNLYLTAIVGPVLSNQIRYHQTLSGNLSAEDLFTETISAMNDIDRGATAIKTIAAPKSAKKTHDKAEDLAGDLFKRTDDVRDKVADTLEMVQRGTADAGLMQWQVGELARSVDELSDKAMSGIKKIDDIGFCVVEFDFQ